jgi:quercetin dioxygenase-like cupin family protein
LYDTLSAVTSPTAAWTIRPLSTAELAAIVCRQARAALPMEALGRDARERNGIRVVHTPEYDVWLLRWPPRTRVTPHDHGHSAGAFSVLDGELIELRWRSSVPDCRLVTPGEVVSVGRGVVHDVVATTRVAYSVHAYSPPLQTMSFYDVPSPETSAGGSPGSSRDVSLESAPAAGLIGG